jgi:hypothetical protein
MPFSPGQYFPTATPSAYPYVNCQTLFRVEDGNLTNSYSYNNVIDVITFEDSWKSRFNCGALELRAEAVRRAKEKLTLISSDGMIHVFLTRSLSLYSSECTGPDGCTTTGVSGASDSANYGTGLPVMPIVFLALESRCNPIVANGIFALTAGHELGHEGSLPHDVPSASPTNGSLMETTGYNSSTSQNYYLYQHTTYPVYNQCTSWTNTMNGIFDSDPVNLNQ